MYASQKQLKSMANLTSQLIVDLQSAVYLGRKDRAM